MRAPADPDGAFHLLGCGVEDSEMIAAHNADNQPVAMPYDAGRFRTDWHLPNNTPRLQVNGDHGAVTLDGDEGKARIRAEGDMGRLIANPKPLQKPRANCVVDIHLAALEACNHQKSAVGGEIQVIGVGNAFAAQDGTGCRFNK